MKAIAKYLPVEGEITVGATVIFPNGVIATVLPPNKLTKGKFGYAMSVVSMDRAKEVLNSLQGKEKLTGLFAVTQDIEVGDEISYVFSPPHLKSKLISHKITELHDGDFIMDDGHPAPSDSFKVLGELSPNATWEIKDGAPIEVAQEFIEEGISYYYENMDCKLPGIEKELAVLGPCGHYH